MKAVLCLHDPEEESILCQTFRFANIVATTKHDLTMVLHDWLEHPADLLVISCTVCEATTKVVSVRAL